MPIKRSPLDFQFGECIGEGSYSKVYRGLSIHNRRTYAIKILSKAHIQRERKRKYVTIEKNTLNILGRHPGIVTLYYTFQDSKSLYFVIDFAQNGELLSLIRRLGSLSEPLSRYYMTQLVDAIGFVHSKGIVHRDLKPENILLNSEWKLMVTDFGAAKILTDDEKLRLQSGKLLQEESIPVGESNGSFVGTAEYVSPELLKYNQCGFAGDMWALGCILYQLIFGRPPFKGPTEYDTFEKIVHLDYSYPPEIYVPDQFKDLVSHLLVLSPDERYTIEDVKNHPWFKGIDWDDKDSIWKRPTPKLEPYTARVLPPPKVRPPRIAHYAQQPNSQAQPQQRPVARQPQQQQPATPYYAPQRITNPMPGYYSQVRNQNLGAQMRGNAQLMDKVQRGLENHNVRRNSLQFADDAESSSVKPPKPVTLSSPAQSPKSSPSSNSPHNFGAHPAALSAAGAVGGSFRQQKPQQSSNNAAYVNPVLISKKIPKDILGQLQTGEKIIKLDNIFMSELTHKPGQFVPKGQALTDVVINKIITTNYQTLNKELKSCILLITSAARLFIYEISPDKGYHTQGAAQMQAAAFYSRVVEVRLTSKNVSMYDYEFDEDLKEGYLILELLRINTLYFLSAYDPDTIVQGGINANVEIGFKVNEDLSWIDALLKAKEMIKKKPRVVTSAAGKAKKSRSQSPASPALSSPSSSSLQSSHRGVASNMRRMHITESPTTSKDGMAAAAAARSFRR